MKLLALLNFWKLVSSQLIVFKIRLKTLRKILLKTFFNMLTSMAARYARKESLKKQEKE